MTTISMILKGLTLLLALFFVFLGLQWLFVPHNLAPAFYIEPAGIGGLATMRADLGAFFFSTGVITALGVRDGTHANTFLFCATLLIGTAAVGRVAGFLIDGVTSSLMTPFIVELIIVALFVALASVRIKLRNLQPTMDANG